MGEAGRRGIGVRKGVTAGELAVATGIARATVASTVARLAGIGTLERVELAGGGVGFRLPKASPPGAVSTGAAAS
jgi:hypothetical protein